MWYTVMFVFMVASNHMHTTVHVSRLAKTTFWNLEGYGKSRTVNIRSHYKLIRKRKKKDKEWRQTWKGKNRWIVHRSGGNNRGYIGVKGHLMYLLIPVLTVCFLDFAFMLYCWSYCALTLWQFSISGNNGWNLMWLDHRLPHYGIVHVYVQYFLKISSRRYFISWPEWHTLVYRASLISLFVRTYNAHAHT